MPRIRSIKPEFWTSEQVTACSREARLLFIGMWSFSDDAGRHPASIARLKMEVLPGDPIEISALDPWIQELIDNELVLEYEVDEKKYWQVTGWKKHQRIEKPTIKFPGPGSKIRRPVGEESSNGRRIVDEGSTTTPGGLDPGLEWSGEERSGVDKRKIHTGLDDGQQPAPPLAAGELFPVGHKQKPKQVDINPVIVAYQKHHPRARPGRKERLLIRDRIKEGYTIGDLLRAIEGCHRSPHHCGENSRGVKYQSLSLIFRDSSHVAMFLEFAATPNKDTVRKVDRARNLELAIFHRVRQMRQNGATQEQIDEVLTSAEKGRK